MCLCVWILCECVFWGGEVLYCAMLLCWYLKGPMNSTPVSYVPYDTTLSSVIWSIRW